MSPPGFTATPASGGSTSAVTPEMRAEYVARLVAAAPPVSAETRERLAALLRPAASGGRAA